MNIPAQLHQALVPKLQQAKGLAHDLTRGLIRASVDLVVDESLGLGLDAAVSAPCEPLVGVAILGVLPIPLGQAFARISAQSSVRLGDVHRGL